MSSGYGISNKQYAAVAAGSLAIAALLCAGIRAGYAAVDAEAARQAAEQELLAQRVVAEEEVRATAVAQTDMSGAFAAASAVLAAYEGQGRVAVSVRMVDGSGEFDINGDMSMPSASMIKLLVLAEYLDEVDAGELSGTDTYTLDVDDIVGGSGSMQADRPGTEYALDEVARRMIYQSDNVATNALIDAMGIDRIQQKAESLGLGGTLLVHKLMSTDEDGLNNAMSANDASALLAWIADGTLASAGSCERAEEFLLAQEDDEGLAQGIPAGVAFGHKTGSTDEVRHDGGIVYAERPYVICVLTEGIDYDEANTLMAQISAAVYDALA